MFINFGAVDQIATVFINGAEVATHKGGYTPFKFEITDYIKDGENEIRVVCLDFSDTNEFSRGKQKIKRGGIWYTCQSGIWQSVWLESTPKNFLKRLKLHPTMIIQTYRLNISEQMTLRCLSLTAIN